MSNNKFDAELLSMVYERIHSMDDESEVVLSQRNVFYYPSAGVLPSGELKDLFDLVESVHLLCYVSIYDSRLCFVVHFPRV